MASNAPMERTKQPGIYRRGKRYVAVFRDPSGKQCKRSAATLAEARALRDGARTDIRRGEYREPCRTSFEDYGRAWIESYAGRTSRGFKESTRDDYRDQLERHAYPLLGRLPLSEISPPTIKTFIAKLAATGLSYNSVRLALAPVRAALADAFEDGLIRTNPALGVRIKRETPTDAEQERPRALSPDELGRLIAETPASHRLLVEFLAQTGLRVGEAAGLRWADLDLGKRRVKIRRTLQRDRKRKTWSTTTPKSRYGVRDVPLSPALARRLWQARKDAGNPADDAYVFAGPKGAPLDAVNAFNRILKPAARRAGVAWAGWHTLRHTAATMMFRHGWNPKQVQVVLGHHSPAFTLERYVHLLPDDLPDVAFFDDLQLGQGGNRVATREAETTVDSSPVAATGTG